MRHAALTTIRIASLLAILAMPRTAAAEEADALKQARAFVAADEHHRAAVVMEDALADSEGGDAPALVSLLQETYTVLIQRARDQGRDQDAALYQDNLAILKRSTPSASAPTAAPAPAQSNGSNPTRSIAAPAASSGPSGPTPNPGPDSTPKPAASTPPSGSHAPVLEGPAGAPPASEQAGSDQPTARPNASVSMDPKSRQVERGTPSPPRPTAAPDSLHRLNQADRAFQEKRYDEAGRLYSQLAEQHALPADRNEVWAYCRWTEIVRRINAKPRSAEEWDAVETEIRQVREIHPNSWYGEYLLSRVAEARKTRRSIFPFKPRAERLLVRGSEPEEFDVDLPASSAPETAPSASKVDGSKPTPRPRPPAEVGRPEPAAAPGSRAAGVAPTDHWRIHESPNFRIFHQASPELAEQAAQVAESVRTTQGNRWSSPALRRSWNPKCEIYLYSNGGIFAKMTGQPETSPGFTTMGANGGAIISRRVNLRADHPQLLAAVLPHEVTHVVLADLFPNRPIPRWADEGMAVLAEPPAEAQSRAAELNGPLREDRVFALADLLKLDQPNAEDWSTYYAQSVSLTRFLVEQGRPSDFIAFLQESQRSGIDAALGNVYQINGVAELQGLWLTYARDQAAGTDSRADVAAAEPDPVDAGETR